MKLLKSYQHLSTGYEQSIHSGFLHDNDVFIK